jgi:hypothetical protein
MSDHDPTRPDLHDDDQLLVHLGLALDELDPVPVDALATAKAALELSRADAELAELVFDSLLDAAQVAMRHDMVEGRSLEYVVRGHRLAIELSEDAVLGHLDPAQPARVELESTAGRRSADVDEHGRFAFTGVRGLLRLHVVVGDGAPVVTPWITW